LLVTSSTPTTSDGDVWEGVSRVRDAVAEQARHTPALEDEQHVLACSSAGGGLRLAVVGFERDVTARAVRVVALSAGASVVYLGSGALTPSGIEHLRDAEPDLVLLVGGTDGGNAQTLLHNAARLAHADLSVPVVAAGNRDAAQEVHATLSAGGVRSSVADNVLPRIGRVSPDSARRAIRDAFLTHVIGGKHLSRHPSFTTLVRRATPDAVIGAVRVLREVTGHDVMVIDVGGATTDVYSAVEPHGGDAAPRQDVVGSLRVARTVEGDLGMRYTATGVIDAATREAMPVDTDLQRWAEDVGSDPRRTARSAHDRRSDLSLASVCAVVAARRHARPHQPTATPRPLAEVHTLIASGGVFRREGLARTRDALLPVARDVGGGWQPPDRATIAVDAEYVLASIGLMADEWPQAAASLAAGLARSQGR